MNVSHTGSEKKGPHVVITAGVHGDEYEPMFAAREIAARLPDKLVKGRVSIVFTTNESACAAGTRLGEDGLDLARVCPGDPAGSATLAAAAEVSALIEKADYYIDLHTGGRLFEIYPLAGYMLHASAEVLDRQRMMARAFGLPVIWGTDRYPQGRTLSVARDAGVPAIYVEYGGGETIREEVIDAYLAGVFNILGRLRMVRGLEGGGEGLQRVVEEDQPESGHLQSKMPAPERGVFRPAVRLGAPVRRGQVWGHICDLREGRRVAVEADRDGMVLFLRRSPRVEAGESLGGILPIGLDENKDLL